MTDLFDSLVAVIVAVALNTFVLSRMRRRLPGDEGQVLRRIYLWTLTIRFLLAFFLNASSSDSTFSATFWGDSNEYDHGGILLARYWGGESLVNPYLQSRVSGWGFYYFVAAVYFVFGQNQLLVQLINGTIGAVTVIVIYAIAKDIYDVPVAQWAARFMAFFPQMVFWSGAMYKDPAIMLCISLCMYGLLQLRTRFTVAHLAIFIIAALTLMTLRFYVFYFVAFATLGTFILSQKRGFLASIFTQGLVLGTFLIAFSFAASQESLEQHSDLLTLKRVEVSRSDQARYASGFGSESDVSTPAGALGALPVGLVYLLFAPFPWSISGIRQLLTVPETLVWYALFPSLIRGLSHAIRHKFRHALPILVFAASLTCAYGIFQSNVGTAYRQRTQITMFFFIFMAAGYVQKKRSHMPVTPARPAAWTAAS